MGRGGGASRAARGGGGAATVDGGGAAPPGALGTSAATVTYLGNRPADELRTAALERAEQLLGRTVDDHQLATLAGAPDDARVTVIDRGNKLILNIDSDAVTSTRYLYRDGNKVVIENAYLVVEDHAQGRGLGASILGRQVRQAAALGVDEIRTEAARSPSMVGYKVWPRLGYDAPLPAGSRGDLPVGIRSARKVGDLMRTEAGRAWWDRHGDSTHMTFDPKPGSYSRRILDAYLQHRGIN